jgi:ribosomal protein S12 methylthiotransferase accessory factor YcaO
LTEVDCRELTADEQIALAGAITDALRGSGIALVKGRKIVLDRLSGAQLDLHAVDSAIAGFIRRRKDASHYSIERQGDRIVVHSPDPIAGARAGKHEGLPPNLFKCPYCAYATPYEEAYEVHYKSHLFAV